MYYWFRFKLTHNWYYDFLLKASSFFFFSLAVAVMRQKQFRKRRYVLLFDLISHERAMKGTTNKTFLKKNAVRKEKDNKGLQSGGKVLK